MAGWPSIERADDQRIVQALRSGDGAAPAHLYDLYAASLFDYCHVLLRDEEAAARAVHDALITVRERIGELPDPGLFRGLLYAVARVHCVHLRAQVPPPAERRRAAEVAGGHVDEATLQLVHAAMVVLAGRQREVLDLSLRHDLDVAELAEVLRTTPQDASMLVAQARHDLDDAVAAVTVATTGRDDCPSVAALAGPYDQGLDAEACGRLSRHIASCPICVARGDDGRVDTARVLRAMPFAAIPTALRERFFATATDPRLADRRAAIAARAEPPAETEDEEERRDTSRRWPPVMAAVATGILAIGAVWFALPGSNGKNTSDNQAIASSPGALPSDSVSAPDTGGPLPSDGVTSPSPTPSTSSTTPTPTPTPGHTDARKRGHLEASSSGPTTAPAGPPTTAGPPAPPAPGTLTVNGCTMNHRRSCAVTVVAQGGPVDWHVSGTSGSIRASGGGHLNAGESTGVTASLDATLCIGSGSGSVYFSSGARATVNWRC